MGVVVRPCASASRALAALFSATRFCRRSWNSVSLSVRALFLGLSCGCSCCTSADACLRFVVVVTVVVVMIAGASMAASLGAGDVFRDAALDGALRVGGSAEGARETLRLRVVVVSGEASAAFCDRVAGIVLGGGGRCSGCRGGGEREDGVVDGIAQGRGQNCSVAREGTCMGIFTCLLSVAIVLPPKKEAGRPALFDADEGAATTRAVEKWAVPRGERLITAHLVTTYHLALPSPLGKMAEYMPGGKQ